MVLIALSLVPMLPFVTAPYVHALVGLIGMDGL
jgi:hypothetical protein